MTDNPESPGPPGNAAEDLRATADSIEEDLRRLASVEGEKERLDPADPQTDRLSTEAVRLADRIARQTKAERALADELG